ncbi:hypothetical protein LCGC14_0720510 [marine sediment metagenome]|uniref:Uncharacterized protein n=1 Tax=marine sediment metagenome TaxID=412755 RepID=A0A0F9TJZ9_9ZZZZ
MPAHTLNKGWLHINEGFDNGSGQEGTGYGMSLRFKKGKYDPLGFKIEREVYPGDGRIGYDLNYRDRFWQFNDIIFENQNDAEACIRQLDILQNTGPYHIQVQTDDSPTYLKLDGTATGAKVLCSKLNAWEKMSDGNQHIYMIKSLKFVQSG